jgi:anti-sigma regulatory factor (Ser/Thr protein kinase)
MNATAAFAVSESSQIAEPRRAALWLASHLDFPDDRAGRVALVVSELATNLTKHAKNGEILLRPLTADDGSAEGIEIAAVDKGPGIPDAALRDGYSTTGTLGHGLGAIGRQADFFDFYTQPTGSAIVARVLREGARSNGGRPRYEIGAVHVSKAGEPVSGDAWSWRMRNERLAVFLADGLGHGLQAFEAADAAVRVFAQAPESAPRPLIESVHAALRPTRGAAIASLVVDLERGVGVFCGLGNISGVIIVPGGRHHMVSHNGTAGHTAGRIQEFTYPVPRNAVIVLYSDGLGTHWDLNAYPGLTSRSASVIAGTLYRDFSRRRDDVTVVVAKERTPVAEKL